MKTLFMADLDGTILPKGDKLPIRVETTLNSLMEKGLRFTINTSRTPISIAPVIKNLRFNLPIILMNGSCVYDTKTGKVIALNTINSVTASVVLSVCKSEGFYPFMFDYSGGDVSVYYTRISTEAEQDFYNARKEYYKSFKKVTNYSPKQHTPYIICVGKKEKLLGLQNRIERIKQVSYSLFANPENNSYFLEIYAKNAGKANAAKRFMKVFSFDRLTAFGDNLNDVEMLQIADTAIAVSNAFDEVKAVANKVIGSCSEGAVAEWLSHNGNTKGW